MAFLHRTVLNPFVTGPAYLLLTQAPTSFRDQVLQQLSQYLPNGTLLKSIGALKWLTCFGLIRRISSFLNDWAQNNFRFSSGRHRYDWPDEIAVVTGGTGGFGSLICKGLASKGISVVCVDIRDAMSEEMQVNPKIHYHKCDITSPSAVTELGRTVKAKYGHPSILINNAGIAYNHQVLTATTEELNKIYGVNLFSHYYVLQQFLPHMIDSKKGHVVALASMASFVTQAGMSSYAGTKAAVLVLHEALKQETRVVGNAPEVLFSIVHPFYADTPMYRQFQAQIDAGRPPLILKPEIVADAVVNQILSGRGGQIVIGGVTEWVSGLKGWPQWMQQIIMRASDAQVRAAGIAAEAKAKVRYGSSQ